MAQENVANSNGRLQKKEKKRGFQPLNLIPF